MVSLDLVACSAPNPISTLPGLPNQKDFIYQQVDRSTYDGGGSELPDGLANFRMNLGELLMDICHFLGSAAYIQKVLENCLAVQLHLGCDANRYTHCLSFFSSVTRIMHLLVRKHYSYV